MTKISFFGAVGTVTGSRHLLETDGLKILIDCGMFQGLKENRLKNWENFPVDPSAIDHIFLTHAHIDHSGYLPRLYQQGFRGKIHSTHATRDLCEIMLKDSAHLQEEDAKWANKRGYSKHKPALPLYTVQDAEDTLKLFTPHYYGEEIFLNDRLRIKFKDAGHILGSSFIDIKRADGRNSKRILFSGDFGRPDRPILREPVQVYNVDYLIVESTYGNRLHDEMDPKEELTRVINDSYHRKGVLVIPAFSVGRTQTLLYAIRELETERKIPELSIFVDSPMAINATEVFKNRIHDLNISARKKDIEGISIFSPKNLHICKTRDESKEINKVKGGAIIISASGMATGGRILHHLAERIPDRRNTVLFIGYQAEGTRGRTLLEGKEQVKIHGRKITVKAKIENISGFSGHGDYDEILAWLSAFNKIPQKTFIVHGEEEASAAMADKIRSRFGWKVAVPKFGDSFELDF
jgi:metallo-beta-lactamase family protein